MKQTDLSLNLTTKRTCMREFLAQMGLVRPWAEVELLAPYKPDGKDEPHASCSAVDAAHSLMQQWFTLSDPPYRSWM